MQSFDFKKLKLDAIIIIGFAVLSLLYCYPQLQGKKLKQDDVMMWQGMSREAMAYHDSTGKDVLWSNSMFSGMPTYTTYTAADNYNYPSYFQTVLEAVGKPAYFFFIAMLCFYILMRVLGVNRWLGVAGAIAYAFASYNSIIIGVGHDTKMLTIGYLPAAFAGIYLIYKEKWLTGAALFGFSMALIGGNNHYQMMYYFIIICLCFAVSMFIVAVKEKKLKQFFISSLIAALTGVLGILPTITSVMTTNEYAKETMRGGGSQLSGHDKKTNGGLDKDYAFGWSMGVPETFSIMIPYLYGGATYEPSEMAPKTLEFITNNTRQGEQIPAMLPVYWGTQPTQMGPVYFGAIICFLFLLGMLTVRSPHKWWILAASIIGIVLAWGKNFAGVNYFLFDHVPYLNKFRTVEMALVIPQFLFPLLGIWAVQDIIDKKVSTDVAWKNIKIAAGITAGFCLLLGVLGSMFFNFTGPQDAGFDPRVLSVLKDDRSSWAMMSGLKSMAYILLGAGLLWAFIKDKIKSMTLIIGLCVIIAIDLMPVAHNYLNERNFVEASDAEAVFQPRPVDREILQDKDPYYRVFDISHNAFNDAIQSYFHKCIGGYHPAKMEIYQDLIERQIGGANGSNWQVLNMLNMKYMIVGEQQKVQEQVVPNPRACGNAWFVNEIKWANTADEEMDGLNAPRFLDTTMTPNAFNPRETAIVRATFKDVIGNYSFGRDSAANIKLTKYGLDDLAFRSSNSKDGFAVFSDIYYSAGWKAYVDGKETPIVKANYVLRAIKIPAGQHDVTFEFRPKSFYGGRKIALAGSIMLFILLGLSLYPLFKKGKETPAKTKA